MAGRRGLIAAALVVAVVAVGIAVLSSTTQSPLAARGVQATAGPFWLGWTSTTASAFRHLGLPAMTELEGGVEIEGADGNKPEIVTATLRSLASESDILAHYQAACRALGLNAPAPADALASRPDLLCEGRYKGYAVGVIVAPDCAGGECRVHVELQGTLR
ncbi:MAG: hypothetical protein K5872_12110 [Rhizobiaceae bacterium]|nr:hypothetical protein [Rhizobiaceae bacterium]MCV0406960.1 hypothetical protein [Rhizobiaceae bacterium]